MKVGSLFAGIGGFDLGFERAGMETAWFVERNPYCQKVLAKHWPDTPIYDDVCAVTADTLAPIDLLCGGFPCQGISDAGLRKGLEDERSGLWSEFSRLIREIRPRYVVVENVEPLRRRGLDRVLGDLAESGYDAEWDCIPASAVGAPHRRDRIWIVAYPNRDEQQGGSHALRGTAAAQLLDPDGSPVQSWGIGRRAAQASGAWWWTIEPNVGRVAYGIPNRLDRLSALGNALVPQVAEWIGRRIVEFEAAQELKEAA